MYSEKAKRKETGVLFIVLVILFVYFLTRFTLIWAPVKFRLFAEIGNILLVCYIIWLIVRFKITDYIYTIKKDTLYIDKQLGKRITNVLELKIKEIVCIENMEEIDNCKYKINKRYNYGPNFLKRNKYFILYKQDNDNYNIFSFKPSEKLIKKLKSKVSIR